MQEYNYTLSSFNPNDYSIIKANLKGPSTELMEFIVTNLTTKCSFHVLTRKDYISFTFDGKFFKITIRNFSEINKESLKNILNDRCMGNLSFGFLKGNRLAISSTEPFSIEDMSYNIKLLTGFFMFNFQFHLICDMAIYQLSKILNH